MFWSIFVLSWWLSNHEAYIAIIYILLKEMLQFLIIPTAFYFSK